jgi:uncharacterized protein YndB with AHSA1/START domain
MNQNRSDQTDPQELMITRLLAAAPEAVWKAWTEPDRIQRWWGPKAFTAPSIELDFREGGKYLYCMRSPDGKDYWSTGVFREIVPGQRIVVTDSFADEAGRVVPATHYGMGPSFPLEMQITATFEAEGSGTRLTLRHAGLPAGPDREGATQGWNESLDKLAASLA